MEVYGKDAAQTFTTNHALQIVFPPKASETQTARDISEWLGYQTVKGVSESKGKAIFSKRHHSESISDQRRALMLPQEITSLGQDKELVIAENIPPILAKKVVYYKNAVFIDRIKEVSPSLRALGKHLPTPSQLDAAIFAGELRAPVPEIDLKAHHALVGGDGIPVTATAPPQAGKQIEQVDRPATPEDLPKLSTLVYAIDFSPIPIPKRGDLDETALNAYGDNLLRQAGVQV